MGKYKSVREIIRETVKDGRPHTAEEFEKNCEKNGIYMHKDRGPIYNVVYQLKQKGEIISDGENGYIATSRSGIQEDITCSELPTVECQVDLSEFEVVKPAIRKKTKQVVSVLENGDIALNGALVKALNVRMIEIHIKKDCGQLLLIPDGKEKIDIGKNNRFKNYEIYERLRARKVKLPIYYVGEWNSDKGFWLGDLVSINPNRAIDKSEMKRGNRFRD